MQHLMEARSNKQLLLQQVSRDNVWDATDQGMKYEMPDAEACSTLLRRLCCVASNASIAHNLERAYQEAVMQKLG